MLECNQFKIRFACLLVVERVTLDVNSLTRDEMLHFSCQWLKKQGIF